MSILSNWFRKESTQIILKAALSVLKIYFGKLANEIWELVTTKVKEASSLPISGPEKAKYVYKSLESAWPGIKSHAANLAIELGVAFFKEGLLKK